MRYALPILLIACAAPAQAQRIVPAGDVTLYVAPASNCSGGYWDDGGTVTACGNDTNAGTKAAPLETIQAAHDTFMAGYDFQGKHKPTIQLACANVGGWFGYAGALMSGRLVGQVGTMPPLAYKPPNEATQYVTVGKYLPYTLRGCPSDPQGAFIHWASGMPQIPCVSMSEGAALKLEGITCDTFGFNQDCIDVFTGAFLDIANVVFGHCGYPNKFVGINVTRATLLISGPLTVAGNGASFIQNYQGSVLVNTDGSAPLIPITVSNSPSFPAGLFMIDGGTTYLSKLSINGTYTGPLSVVYGSGVR